MTFFIQPALDLITPAYKIFTGDRYDRPIQAQKFIHTTLRITTAAAFFFTTQVILNYLRLNSTIWSKFAPNVFQFTLGRFVPYSAELYSGYANLALACRAKKPGFIVWFLANGALSLYWAERNKYNYQGRLESQYYHLSRRVAAWLFS